ncbi:MAG: hypothetical protein ACFFDT_19280 [Candidatus Hodarchaeota archaeon]
MAKKHIKSIIGKEYESNQELKLDYPILRDTPDELDVSDLLKNDKIVLEALKYVGSADRGYITKVCALPRTTVYDALMRLERIGVVEKYLEERVKRGRPKTLYRIL